MVVIFAVFLFSLYLGASKVDRIQREKLRREAALADLRRLPLYSRVGTTLPLGRKANASVAGIRAVAYAGTPRGTVR